MSTICPLCEERNDPGATHCHLCNAELVSPLKEENSIAVRERPILVPKRSFPLIPLLIFFSLFSLCIFFFLSSHSLSEPMARAQTMWKRAEHSYRQRTEFWEEKKEKLLWEVRERQVERLWNVAPLTLSPLPLELLYSLFLHLFPLSAQKNSLFPLFEEEGRRIIIFFEKERQVPFFSAPYLLAFSFTEEKNRLQFREQYAFQGKKPIALALARRIFQAEQEQFVAINRWTASIMKLNWEEGKAPPFSSFPIVINVTLDCTL